MNEVVDRSLGLGASDAAVAIGKSKWKTPYQLFREKVFGDAPDISELLHIEVGNALEPVAIKRFERNNNLTVGHRQDVLYDKKRPWRWVTLDGVASDNGLVEAKSVGFADPNEWGEDQSDFIPLHYYIQVQHGLDIADLKHAYVPVIMLNRSERLYQITRDDEFINELVKLEEKFYHDYLLPKVAPPLTNMIDFAIAHPLDNGTSIMATHSVLATATLFKDTKSRIKELEEQEERLTFQVAAFMGDATTLLDLNGLPVLTYKQQSRTTLDSKGIKKDHPGIYDAYSNVSSFRVMRIR